MNYRLWIIGESRKEREREREEKKNESGATGREKKQKDRLNRPRKRRLYKRDNGSELPQAESISL